MKDDAIFGTILISRRGTICVVQGNSTKKWSFPKGHCNPGESPFQCARRETSEETGIQIPWQTHRPIKLSVGWYYVIFVLGEFECTVYDTNEITRVEWVFIKELEHMRVNIDINAFLRRLKLENVRDPLWRLIERRCTGHGFMQECQTCYVRCAY